MKHKKNANGLYYKRFTTPPNAAGRTIRRHVQCTAEYNSPTFLEKLIRDEIERHMQGRFTTSDTFKSYAREKFLLEYPAAKNLAKSSRELLPYLLEKAYGEIGSVPLGAVDTRSLSRLAGSLQEKKRKLKSGVTRRAYSDQTVRLTMIAVLSVFRWAKKNGDLSVVPDFQVPKVAQAMQPKPYTSSEAQALIAHARTDSERLMFLLMFDGGLRTSEVLGLQPEQVNFETHILNVDRQFYRGTLKHTKGKRRRDVDMSVELEAALKAVLADRVGVKFVLANEEGEPHDWYWPRWIFRRCRRWANIPHRRVHDSRHSYADLRTANGTDPFKLQKLMGHSDVRTTMGYVHPVAQQPNSILDPQRAAG